MSKEAIQYIKATLAAFGPDESISMTKETWAKLHEAMKALAEQPAQQEPAGWRPATFHRDNLSFNPGFPDEQTVKFWKLQGVEIEYCYTSPLLLSPGATIYTSPPAQQEPIWFWTHPTYGRLYKQPPAQRKPLTDEQPSRWAVFCGICRKQWSVPYQHPGKSVCDDCEAAHGIKGEA